MGEAGIGPFRIKGGTPIPAFGHKGATALANPRIELRVVAMMANGEVVPPSPDHRGEVVNHHLEIHRTGPPGARSHFLFKPLNGRLLRPEEGAA